MDTSLIDELGTYIRCRVVAIRFIYSLDCPRTASVNVAFMMILCGFNKRFQWDNTFNILFDFWHAMIWTSPSLRFPAEFRTRRPTRGCEITDANETCTVNTAGMAYGSFGLAVIVEIGVPRVLGSGGSRLWLRRG
jgi:hypothetical protein